MEKDSTYGKIKLDTMENGLIIELKEPAHTHQEWVEYIKDNGWTTECTEKESMIGEMAEFMKDLMIVIWKKAMVFSNGAMGDNMKDSGKMINSMG